MGRPKITSTASERRSPFLPGAIIHLADGTNLIVEHDRGPIIRARDGNGQLWQVLPSLPKSISTEVAR
jgi:hypothetical protein